MTRLTLCSIARSPQITQVTRDFANSRQHAVTKDHYVYQGQLYIDLGNANRHARVFKETLNTLLKEALAANVKDEVGHFCEAQCLHYGLAPSMTKAVAKVRLLVAMNAKTLRISPNIETIEKDVMARREKEKRKAKMAYFAAQNGSAATAALAIAPSANSTATAGVPGAKR